jgi:hypothetical protein
VRWRPGPSWNDLLGLAGLLVAGVGLYRLEPDALLAFVGILLLGVAVVRDA